MISIETKSLEMGVMRMVGLKKSYLIVGILIQSFLFVLPAISLGFIVSIPILKITHYVFIATMDLRIDILPNKYNLGQTLFLGFFIPILSSIFPILSITKMSLNEALDYQRSKT